MFHIVWYNDRLFPKITSSSLTCSENCILGNLHWSLRMPCNGTRSHTSIASSNSCWPSGHSTFRMGKSSCRTAKSSTNGRFSTAMFDWNGGRHSRQYGGWTLPNDPLPSWQRIVQYINDQFKICWDEHSSLDKHDGPNMSKSPETTQAPQKWGPKHPPKHPEVLSHQNAKALWAWHCGGGWSLQMIYRRYRGVKELRCGKPMGKP